MGNDVELSVSLGGPFVEEKGREEGRRLKNRQLLLALLPTSFYDLSLPERFPKGDNRLAVPSEHPESPKHAL